jgi:hypothetical protein
MRSDPFRQSRPNATATLALVVVALVATACLTGGAGAIRDAGTSSGDAVQVEPSRVTLTLSGVAVTQQFTATVSGTSDPSVTWSVLEPAGCGSVSQTGLYTSPSVAPAGVCHVQATSVADSSRVGSATVTLQDSTLGPCTNLSGSITTLAKGRYCVVGDVIIPAGTRLTIPAGTELIFRGRYHFGLDPALINDSGATSGGLTAIGTASEPIVFRGETVQTGWYGITIANSPDRVQLEYVVIRDTYKDDRNPNNRIFRRGGGLSSYVNRQGTVIRHCQFVNNRAWMVAGALDINTNWDNSTYATHPVEVTDTLFEDKI